MKHSVGLKCLALSVMTMGGLYLWYPLVGVTDLFIWSHGVRNILLAIFFYFYHATHNKKKYVASRLVSRAFDVLSLVGIFFIYFKPLGGSSCRVSE